MNTLFIVFFALLISTLLISLALCVVCAIKNKRRIQWRVHIMFPGHFALAIFALFVSCRWLLSGQERILDYGQLWSVIERGTIEALTSVMSIVGIGSILLGWIYSERDKLTLGKSQIEMIYYRYGMGYAGSLVTHFSATALSILTLKCAAREAALWAFLTVAWGCIPQASICLKIAMNRAERENLALKIWAQDEGDDHITRIHRMIGYLNDAEVRYNSKYCRTLSTMIKRWLLNCFDLNCVACGATVDTIKTASIIFREMTESIPEPERASFEEKVLKNVCCCLEKDTKALPKQKDVALAILCCGYIRFLYSQTKEKMDYRINDAIYYFQQDGEFYKCFGTRIKDFYCGLEWFMFLNQHMGLPRNASGESQENEYTVKIFEQMMLSIFSDAENNHLENAEIAWRQVHPRGEVK